MSAGAPTPGYSNSARLCVTAGPLAGPTICRVVSMLAGRARCPLDRLDDALLVCDAIIEHAPAHATDGRISLEVAVDESSVELRLGPLPASVGDAILSEAAIPGIGNVLTQVASRVSVQPTEGERELLVLVIDFESSQPSSGPVGLAG